MSARGDGVLDQGVAVGARVKLRPAHNWLSRYAPLAKRGRLGTVTARKGDRLAHVEFDTARHGARPITGCFFIGDLIVVDTPKREQLTLTAATGAPA